MVQNSQGDDAENKDFVFTGTVKWFDPIKGFGFIVPDDGGKDILLHINVLRGFGQSSISEGARVELLAIESNRGVQAVELTSITPPEGAQVPDLPEFDEFDPSLVSMTALEPARVKWFDKAKGFGFANVFGNSDDVFLHVEVLRQSGLSDLQPGEALALKVMDGKRGKMAARVQAWETVGSGNSGS